MGKSFDDLTIAYLLKRAKEEASAVVEKAVSYLKGLIDGKVSKTGDTMTGALTNIGGNILIKNTSYADGDTPSSNSSKHFVIQDKNGTNIAHISGDILTTGATRARITATNGSYTNAIHLEQSADGTRSVGVSSPAAWRTALGLGSMATINSPVPVANGGTAGTTADAALRNLGAFNIGGYGLALKAGDNVDTGLVSGYTYYSSQASVSASLAGTPPTTGSGFKIMQIRSYGDVNYVYQIAFTSTEIVIRRRGASTAAWDAWWIPVKSTDTIAIGHGGTGQTAVTTTTTASSIATAGTNITISSSSFSQWGKVGAVLLGLKAGAAIASGATIATLVSGKRPARHTWVKDTGGDCEISTTGAIIVKHAISSGTTIWVETTFLLA